MRVVKEAEVRRAEILDAADRLFGARGFDGTSTNDILDAVGIARGTLYYHFKSKEEILDALIDRYGERVFRSAKAIADDRSIPVVERMLRVLMAIDIREGGGREIIEQIHKPQNALMHQKSKRAVLDGLTPILALLAEEGVAGGIFDTPFPYECMELAVAYVNGVFDDETDRPGEAERAGRLRAFVFNLERVLGARAGTLSCILEAFSGGEGAPRG